MGRDPICAREVIRMAASEVDWEKQREGWSLASFDPIPNTAQNASVFKAVN